MKLIHCADLHLDSKMTAHLPKEKQKQRKEEILHTFLRMVDYAKEHQVDALLLAGDVFDTGMVSAATKNAVYQAIVGNPKITFFYLKGNHDKDGFLLDMEEGERPENLKLFSHTWNYYKLGEDKNVTIAGLELTESNRDSFFSQLSLEKDTFNIVLLHGQEREYKDVDGTEVIPLRELKDRNIDYLALGHVHSYKEGRLDARGIWCYPGCLEGRGYDEAGEHGFVLLEVDFQRRRCHRQFVPFASRHIYRIKVDVTGCHDTREMEIQVKQELQHQKCKERDMVKVTLVGEVPFDCQIHTQWLKEQFQSSFYHMRMEDETTYELDYEAMLGEATLKGEFVRSVARDTILSQEEKKQVIRYGIRMLAGEEME